MYILIYIMSARGDSELACTNICVCSCSAYELIILGLFRNYREYFRLCLGTSTCTPSLLFLLYWLYGDDDYWCRCRMVMRSVSMSLLCLWMGVCWIVMCFSGVFILLLLLEFKRNIQIFYNRGVEILYIF